MTFEWYTWFCHGAGTQIWYSQGVLEESTLTRHRDPNETLRISQVIHHQMDQGQNQTLAKTCIHFSLHVATYTDMCKNTHGPPQTTSILALLLSLSFGSFSILLLLLEWFLQSPWPEIHGRSMGPFLKKLTAPIHATSLQLCMNISCKRKTHTDWNNLRG